MMNVLTWLTRCGLLVVALFLCGVGFAEEDGIDIFLKAVISQQTDSQIVSGKAAYEMSKRLNKSDEEIMKEAENTAASHNKHFPNRPPLDVQEAYVNIKAHYDEKQVFSGNFRFDYSHKNLQYVENQMIFDKDSERPVTVIEKRDTRLLVSKKYAESALFDPTILQVNVSHTRSSVAEFGQFGRVRGFQVYLIAGVVKEKGELAAREEIKEQAKKLYGSEEDIAVLKIVDKQPYDNGATAYTIESSVKGLVTQRYVIVPALGYICPKIELYDNKSGNLIQDYEAADFVLHKQSGLYYPTHYRETKYNASTGAAYENREYTIHQETLSLNEKMSPKDFALDVPEGIRVVDNRGGDGVTYVADAPGVLTLEAGGFDLDKLPWLRNIIAAPPNLYSEYYRSPLSRILLTALGAALILLAVIIRRRKKRNAEK